MAQLIIRNKSASQSVDAIVLHKVKDKTLVGGAKLAQMSEFRQSRKRSRLDREPRI